MNTAISRFWLSLKQPGSGLRIIWSLPLGGLVVLLLTGMLGVQVYAQSAAGGMLQPNDQGEAVTDLQQRLANLGYYSGPITGYFDATTQQAVSQFQQENGLTPDGIVGSATGNVLYSGGYSGGNGITSDPNGLTAASGMLQVNDGGSSVTELQQHLSQLGYYTGTVTGVFDQQTQSAVMSFQRDRGLSPDGIVGRATQAALYQNPAQATTSEVPAYTPTETPNDGLLQLGDVGAEVSTLQSQLQALGYYDGPISGSFGSQTQEALMAFQQAQGLTADGIAGPRVTNALTTTNPTIAAAPQSTVQATAASTPTSTPLTTTPQLTSPQLTTTTVTPSVGQSATPIPSTGAGIVQVPPASTTMLPPPSPQTQPVALQPSASSSSAPVMRSNADSGRFSVMELQRRLQMRGYNLGDMSGVYDTTTQDAILQAQQSYGISPSDLGE